MSNDITALAQREMEQREKFEAWTEESCALPWGYLKKRRTYDGFYSEHTYTSLWAAWKAASMALVEALEKAQQHEQEWKSLCEAAAIDLDDWLNIDDKSRELICKFADAVIAKNERIAELESRTVTVKLPPRVDSSNVPFTAHTWNCCLGAVERCLTAAGIQVIEGEGQ